jgi:cardiolipin synthase
MALKELFEKDKFWTLANFLSFLRILLSFVLYILIINRNSIGAIVIAVIAILSDYGDGYFARKRNEISELGKLLDPLADKIIVALGCIALNKSYQFPLWIVVIIIGRDIFILLGSLLLTTRINRIEASEMPGKVAVNIISVLLLSYLFEFHAAKIPLLILTTIVVLFSFLYYLRKFFSIFLNHRSGVAPQDDPSNQTH